MSTHCHYCDRKATRFKIANAYLWCGICALPKPERRQVLAMFPNETDEVKPTEPLVTANPEE